MGRVMPWGGGCGHAAWGYTRDPRLGQKRRAAMATRMKDLPVPRPILILVIVLVLIVAVLLGLASLDREVATKHVEQPVTNAATH